MLTRVLIAAMAGLMAIAPASAACVYGNTQCMPVVTFDSNGNPTAGVQPPRASYQLETTTALGSAGVFTGPWRSAGASPVLYPLFQGRCDADQPATLYVDESQDGATVAIAGVFVSSGWNGGAAGVSGAVVDSGSITIEAPYYRIRIVNGATAETRLTCDSSFISY